MATMQVARRFPFRPLLLQGAALGERSRAALADSREFRRYGRRRVFIVQRSEGPQEVALLAVEVGERAIHGRDRGLFRAVLLAGLQSLRDHGGRAQYFGDVCPHPLIE
jgi:hypothetical protein